MSKRQPKKCIRQKLSDAETLMALSVIIRSSTNGSKELQQNLAYSLDLMPQNNPNKLYGTKAAAEFLGISPKTLANWRSSGTQSLSHVKLGSRIFYCHSDLISFLTFNTRQSTSDKGKRHA